MRLQRRRVSPSTRWNKATGGFSLVELLVVIGVLTILAAILFPVFASAKKQAKATACVSNLRQIGVSVGIYLADNDDYYPQAVDAADRYRPEIWAPHPDFQRQIPYMPMLHEALMPYARSKEIFRSPADRGTKVLDTHPWMSFPTEPSMYAVFGTSYMFRTEIAFRRFTQSSLFDPSGVNVLFSAAGHWHGDGPALMARDDATKYLSLTKDFRYTVLFGDGRAKSLSFDAWREAWSRDL